MLHHLQAYDTCSDRPLICIPESGMINHNLHAHCTAATFTVVYFLAYSWWSGRSVICNPAKYDICEFVQIQLWNPVVYYRHIIPVQLWIGVTNMALKCRYLVFKRMSSVLVHYSHQVLLILKSVTVVNTDCHLSGHFIIGCWLHVILSLFQRLHLYWISMWRPLLKFLKLWALCQLSIGER